ncbi:MAG: hypothetical protein QM648_07110 [Solirubrobacterales bacterium]
MSDNGEVISDESKGGEAYSNARGRSEAKNQAVRESLEPLAPGERPLAVTIAAIASAIFAIANVAVYALSDHAVGADRGKEVTQTFLISLVLAIAAWGMWKAKYWAVLGFQTILGLQVIVLSLALLKASSWWVVLVFLALIVVFAILFWFLIRAMARLQMPEAPDIRSLREQREEAEAYAAAEAAEQERTEKQDG